MKENLRIKGSIQPPNKGRPDTPIRERELNVKERLRHRIGATSVVASSKVKGSH